MPNYYRHIRRRHPDVTIDIIVDALMDPDAVYKKSKSTKEFYYHKVIGGNEYRVIIVPLDKSAKKVITAYAVADGEPFFIRRKAYCSYNKEFDLIEEDDDYDFFYNAFIYGVNTCES